MAVPEGDWLHQASALNPNAGVPDDGEDVLVAVPEGDWLHQASALNPNAGGQEDGSSLYSKN